MNNVTKMSSNENIGSQHDYNSFKTSIFSNDLNRENDKVISYMIQLRDFRVLVKDQVKSSTLPIFGLYNHRVD